MECLIAHSISFLLFENIRMYVCFFYEVCVVEDRRSMAEKPTDLSSQKGKSNRSYTMEFKRQVVAYANENSNRSAASQYVLEPKRVRKWKKDIYFSRTPSRVNWKSRLNVVFVVVVVKEKFYQCKKMCFTLFPVSRNLISRASF